MLECKEIFSNSITIERLKQIVIYIYIYIYIYINKYIYIYIYIVT